MPHTIHRSRRVRAIGSGLCAHAAGGGPAATANFRENAHIADLPVDKASLCTLTAQQLATYHEQGWVTPEQCVRPFQKVLIGIGRVGGHPARPQPAASSRVNLPL